MRSTTGGGVSTDGQLPVAEHETPIAHLLHGEAGASCRLLLVERIGDGDGVRSMPTVEGC